MRTIIALLRGRVPRLPHVSGQSRVPQMIFYVIMNQAGGVGVCVALNREGAKQIAASEGASVLWGFRYNWQRKLMTGVLRRILRCFDAESGSRAVRQIIEHCGKRYG